jgi:TRAP-type C4-dicarboxylate transport system permease small subunit
VLLSLILAALVNIKQESVALAVGVVLSALAVTLMARAERGKAVAQILVAALPALLLYLGWRWYVLNHFALGELKGLPVEEWHIRELPTILLNMLRAIGERGVFFAILFIALVIAARRLLQRELDLGTRVAALLLGTAVVYNVFLLAAYVAHFEGQMGIEAHSYFRYNTHLGLLLMAALALYARDWRWRQFGGRWRHAMPGLVVLLALIVPLPFLRMLRFDLEVPNLRVYQLAHEAALRLSDSDHLLLILPGDNGTLPPTIEGVLRDLPPRRPNIVVDVASDFATGLADKDYPRALLSCAPPGFALVTEGQGALLKRVGDQWQVEASWAYDPPPAHARWSQVLAPVPLCLPQRSRG